MPSQATIASVGTVSTESGNGSQTKVIYAVNSALWWAFWVDSSHTTLVQCSSSPDLVTWTARASLTLANAHNSNGMDFSVRYDDIASTDVIHFGIVVPTGSFLYHSRAIISGTTITWAAATDIGPNGLTTNNGFTITLDLNHVPIDSDSSNFSSDARVAANADLGTSWVDAWDSIITVDSLTNTPRSTALIPLTSTTTLRINDNAAGNNFFTRLRYSLGTVGGVNGYTWAAENQATNVITAAQEADWGWAVLNDGSVHIVLREGTNSVTDYKYSSGAFDAGTAITTAISIAIDTGIALATDGTDMWAFAISSAAGNDIYSNHWSHLTGWGGWTALGLGSATRTRVGCYQTVVAGVAGLYWTEGTSPYTLVGYAFPATTTPDAPTIGTVMPANASATVQWTPPTYNGNSAITGYTITASPGGVTAAVSGASTSSGVISGLTNGTTYTFTVHATNALGDGPESSATPAATPFQFIDGSGLGAGFGGRMWEGADPSSPPGYNWGFANTSGGAWGRWKMLGQYAPRVARQSPNPPFPLLSPTVVTSNLTTSAAANRTITGDVTTVSATTAVVTRDVTSGAVVTATVTRNVTTAAATATTGTRDVTTTGALQTTNTRDVTSAAALTATITRDTTTSAATSITVVRELATSVAVTTTVTGAVPTTGALQTTVTADLSTSAAVSMTVTGDLTSSAAVQLTHTSDVTSTTALTTSNLADITSVTATTVVVFGDVPTSAAVEQTRTSDLSTAGALSTTGSDDLPSSAASQVTVARDTSSAAAVQMTGTEDAQTAAAVWVSATLDTATSAGVQTTDVRDLATGVATTVQTTSDLGTAASITLTAQLDLGASAAVLLTPFGSVSTAAAVSRSVAFDLGASAGVTTRVTDDLPTSGASSQTGQDDLDTSAAVAPGFARIDITGHAAVSAQAQAELPAQGAVSATHTASVDSAGSVEAFHTADIASSAGITAPASRDLGTSGAVTRAAARELPTAGASVTFQAAELSSAAGVQMTGTQALASAAALSRAPTLDLSSRAATALQATRDLNTRAALVQAQSRDLTSSVALGAPVLRDVPSGAALLANGTHNLLTAAAIYTVIPFPTETHISLVVSGVRSTGRSTNGSRAVGLLSDGERGAQLIEHGTRYIEEVT